MEDAIKKLLLLLRKERIIITKMVQADENKDSFLFQQLKEPYKNYSDKVDILVKKIIDDDQYIESIDYLSNKIDNLIENNKSIADYDALVGLLNTFYLNNFNGLDTSDTDSFSNEYVMHVYEIYLWMINNQENTKEFKDNIREDLVMKIVTSRAMRKYFAGDYEEAEILANPLRFEEYKDRNKLGTIYASLMMSQIELSNGFELLNGLLDEDLFESRKKLLEVEFAAISVILMKRWLLIPPQSFEYSNFTEQIIENASNLVEDYKNRNKKEQTKILIK